MEKRFLYALAAGSLLTLCLVALEGIYSEWFSRGFPLVLFTVLTVEAVIAIDLMLSLYYDFTSPTRANHRKWAPVKAAIAGILAWAWVTLVIDQWPCFFGATGC